jgi:hypothetical protein
VGRITKSARAQRIFRINQLLQLVWQGHGTLSLLEYAKTEYGLTPRQAKDLVDESYEMLAYGLSFQDLRREMAILKHRFDLVRQRAYKERDWDLYLKVLDSEAKYLIVPLREFVANAPPVATSVAPIEEPPTEFRPAGMEPPPEPAAAE